MLNISANNSVLSKGSKPFIITIVTYIFRIQNLNFSSDVTEICSVFIAVRNA